jgi:hypothetical protein
VAQKTPSVIRRSDIAVRRRLPTALVAQRAHKSRKSYTRKGVRTALEKDL